MIQFNLSEWLQNKSRKVVTRDGRPARILDYNLKGDKRICIAVDDKTQESVTTVDEDGHSLRDEYCWHKSNFDSFFADEKDDLTEFEKAIYQYICIIVTACEGEVPGDKELKPIVKQIAKELRDLSIKGIEKEDWRTPLRAYKNGYDQAMQDIEEFFQEHFYIHPHDCHVVQYVSDTPLEDIDGFVEQFKNHMQDEM